MAELAAAALCAICGASASLAAVDVRRVESPNGWAVFEPVGLPKYGCNKHPVHSVEHVDETARQMNRSDR